jgi:hypothetical protein
MAPNNETAPTPPSGPPRLASGTLPPPATRQQLQAGTRQTKPTIQQSPRAIALVIWFLGLFSMAGLMAVTFLYYSMPEKTTTTKTIQEKHVAQGPQEKHVAQGPQEKQEVQHRPDFSALIALVGTALGALASMLAQTSIRQA